MGDEPPAVGPQHVPSILPFPARLELSGNLSQNWKRFKRVWENYEIASGLVEMGNEKRIATFLTCLGPEGIEIYDSLQFEPAEENKMDKILEKFNTFCVGETNETYERYTFNSRNQETDETFDTYLSAVRTLAKTCNFGELKDSLIRDRIVIGISDKSTKKKLLQNSKLTLKTCVDICRANEQSGKQVKNLSNPEEEIAKISARPK